MTSRSNLTARLALALSLIALLLASLVVRHEGASVLRVEGHAATTPAVGTGYALVDQPAIQQRLWHLPHVNYVVESAYSYEDGLVGGNAAVADQDALVGYGVHDRVHLPGGHQDKYVYYGSLDVYGSGIVALFASPTGGRFALLHLTSVALDGVSASAPYVYRGPVPAGVDDATGLAVQEALAGHVDAVGPRIVRGGAFVGISGWPSSYEYSNGSCNDIVSCASDSHICSVSDATAQAWLLWLAAGHDLPKPKPAFPIKAWRARTNRISPYDGHHHLLRIATFWRQHAKRLGGILRRHSVPKSKHNGHAYIVWRFVHGRVTTWVEHPKWKLRITH